MKFPFQDSAPESAALRGSLCDEALEELCERKQACQLATPYVSLDSRFLERTEQDLVMRANLSQDSARHTLGAQPFKIRFPWALTMYAGPTRLLGYEQDEKQRRLRVALPEFLAPDERRGAFRIDRVGRSSGAIATPDGRILRVSLEDLSTTGAGLFAQDPVPEEGFQVGRVLALSLSLDHGPTLETSAVMVHLDGQTFGVRFEKAPDMAEVRAWMEPKIQELKRLWENRAEIRAKAIQAAKPKLPPAGVLLLTGEESLGQTVAETLHELFPVRACGTTVARFREAMEQPPLLLVVDSAGGSLEERHRMRGLLEAVPPACPVLVLGRSGNTERCRLFATELKATLHIEWNPGQAAFFRRLVQGLIRKHWPETGAKEA